MKTVKTLSMTRNVRSDMRVTMIPWQHTIALYSTDLYTERGNLDFNSHDFCFLSFIEKEKMRFIHLYILNFLDLQGSTNRILPILEPSITLFNPVNNIFFSCFMLPLHIVHRHRCSRGGRQSRRHRACTLQSQTLTKRKDDY